MAFKNLKMSNTVLMSFDINFLRHSQIQKMFIFHDIRQCHVRETDENIFGTFHYESAFFSTR